MLLAPDLPFYKANLHCHSTVSDGHLTPEELKTAYKEKGYAILALTDHEQLREHSDLNDSSFLTITAYEMSVRDGARTERNNRVVHMNLYAKDPHNTAHVCFDREDARKYYHPPELADMACFFGEPAKKEYSPAYINRVLREARAKGFLASYNHPDWGLEREEDYLCYDGFFAVEVYNHSCFMDVGLSEENLHVYDSMLRAGKRLFCTCNDDNHNRCGLTPGATDSFGGFTMIQAPSLTYESVICALERGDFYGSCGPEIYGLWAEDGVLHVRCSPVRDVLLGSDGRKGCHARDTERGITEAAFPLQSDWRYVRLTLIDHQGRKAFSRAYFSEELRR